MRQKGVNQGKKIKKKLNRERKKKLGEWGRRKEGKKKE